MATLLPSEFSQDNKSRREKRAAIRLIYSRLAHPFRCTQVESESVSSAVRHVAAEVFLV